MEEKLYMDDLHAAAASIRTAENAAREAVLEVAHAVVIYKHVKMQLVKQFTREIVEHVKLIFTVFRLDPRVV